MQLDLNFEIVLVIPRTDHVSAGCFHAYENLLTSRIQILYDKNEGIYSAMNMGVLNANGKYSVFLNTGDEVFDSIDIEGFTSEIRNVKQDWVVTNPILSWPIEHIKRIDQINDFFTLKTNVFISHQSILFRTEALREIGGYNTRYKVIGDTALIYEFFKLGEPYMSDLNFSKVEVPNFASLNQRRSRIEFLSLVLFKFSWSIKVITIFNFLNREIRFLHHRIRITK